MRYIDHAAPPKPASKGAAGVGAAVGHQAPRAKQIAAHVQHYSENPRAHAKALRQLGVPAAQVQQIHKSTRPTRQARLAPLSTGEAKKLKPYTHQQALEKAAEIGLNQAGIRQHNVSGLSGITHLLDRGPVNKTLTGLGEAGLYAVPGAAITAKNIGTGAYHDVGSTVHGKPTVRRTVQAAKPLIPNVRRDIHAARHGDFSGAILDTLAVASAGAGGAARLGAAGRAVRAGEGVGRAVTRKGYEGGSLVHRPEPGTVTLKAGPEKKFTVEKPLSRNAALRQVQKARYRRKQVQLDQNAAKPIRNPPHRANVPQRVRDKLGPENTMGNLHRTQRRIEQSVAVGDVHYLKRAAKRLKGIGNQTAWRVANIEGEHAFKHPDEVIDRHIATHQRELANDTTGANRADQEAIIRNLELARAKLKDPNNKALHEAYAAGRAVSEHGAAESFARGTLDKRTADRHLAQVAEFYGSPHARSAPSISRAARKVALANKPSRAVERAQARVDRLEKHSERAAAKEFNVSRIPSHLGGNGPGPTSSRLTAALSVAKDELQRLKQAQETRRATTRAKLDAAKNTESQVPPGSVYFHLGRPAGRTPSGVYNPQPGSGRIPFPQATRYAPEMRRQWRALGLKHGYVPPDMSAAIESSFMRRLKGHSQLDLHKAMTEASTRTRQSLHDRPIGISKKIEADYKRYLRQVEKHPDATNDELGSLTKQDLEKLNMELFPDKAIHANTALGGEVKGVRWVHEGFLKDIGVDVKHPVLDAVTNPIRAGQLYLRPAYLLNAIGNAAMVAPEGPGAVTAMWRSARSDSLYGPRVTAWADSSMGSGKALGQAIKTGLLHKTTQGLAEFWNTVTDMHMRRGALLLEAKRAGFTTRAELDRLRSDPALAGKRNEVIQRARAILGDYENLTPLEKNTIRRVIYFYPWLKVATHWTGHMVGEHPIQSAILAGNSRVESAHAKKIMGLLPQWARLSGLIPIGKSKAGMIDTVNPASVNTPSSVVQSAAEAYGTGRSLLGIPKKGFTAGLGDALTPSLNIFASAAGQTGSPSSSQAPGALGQLEQLPLAGAAKRAGLWGKPSKSFPGTGAGPALLPLAGAGLVPKQTSLTQLNKTGETEHRAGLSTSARTAYDFERFRGEMKTAIQHKYGHSDIPKPIAERLNLWQERVDARRHSGKTWQQHISGDLDVILRHGWITQEQAANAKANLGRLQKNKRSGFSRWLTDTYFDRDGFLHGGAKHLGLKLPPLH